MVRVPCCTGTRSDHGVSLVLTTFVVSELTVKSHTHTHTHTGREGGEGEGCHGGLLGA